MRSSQVHSSLRNRRDFHSNIRGLEVEYYIGSPYPGHYPDGTVRLSRNHQAIGRITQQIDGRYRGESYHTGEMWESSRYRVVLSRFRYYDPYVERLAMLRAQQREVKCRLANLSPMAILAGRDDMYASVLVDLQAEIDALLDR